MAEQEQTLQVNIKGDSSGLTQAVNRATQATDALQQTVSRGMKETAAAADRATSAVADVAAEARNTTSAVVDVTEEIKNSTKANIDAIKSIQEAANEKEKEQKKKDFWKDVRKKAIDGFSTVCSAISDRLLKIGDEADKIGVSANGFQRLERAATNSGEKIENVSAAVGNIRQKAIAALGGDSGAIKAFSELGISAVLLRNSSPEAIFDNVVFADSNSTDSIGEQQAKL